MVCWLVGLTRRAGWWLAHSAAISTVLCKRYGAVAGCLGWFLARQLGFDSGLSLPKRDTALRVLGLFVVILFVVI